MTHFCGFMSLEEKKPVPLKEIEIKAEVTGFIARITSNLKYENTSDNKIEAAFTFPVDDKSAVYEFEATLNGRTIVAEVQEKKQAKETYDDAVKAGYTTTLLEESDSSSDIFRCKVGNLEPQARAELKFSFVTELDVAPDGATSFVLPTVLCPRYNPHPSDGGMEQPPKTPYVAVASAPYSFKFEADIRSNDTIVLVESKHEKVRFDFADNTKKLAKVTLAEPFKPSHDLAFDIYTENASEPKAFLERGRKDKGSLLKQDVAMLNFFPKLPEDSYSNAQEFIFIIDRSGSMGGSRINSAKQTLLLLLKSLPVGCYFNIVSFGSSHSSLFSSGSKEYNEESLAEAMELQASMTADYGGTEILAPLRDVYNKAVMPTHSRQIFLLTDGEVYNTDTVIKLVESNANTARVFTFGIGDGVSTSLINGIAKAGRGKAEFVRDSDRLQAKVMKSMKAATQASVTSVKVSFSPEINFTQLPEKVPAIFGGDRLVLYAIIPAGMDINSEQTSAVVSGKIGEQVFETKANFVETSCEADNESLALHRLAAKSQIKNWEIEDKDDKKKNEIVLLSTAANIISKHTSMVAVDKEHKTLPGNHQPQDIPLPIDFSVQERGSMEESYSRYSFNSYAVPAGMPMAKGRNRKYLKLKKSSNGSRGRGSTRSGSSFQSKNSSLLSSGIQMCPPAMAMCAAGPTMTRCAASGPPPPRRMMKSSVMCDSAMDYDEDEEESDDCLMDSSPAPPKGKKMKKKSSDYMDVIQLQNFSGSWDLTADFCQQINGVNEETIKNASPITDLTVWATIFALAYLELKFGDKKDEWEMVEMKSKRWLTTQAGNMEGKSVDELLEMAKKVLSP